MPKMQWRKESTNLLRETCRIARKARRPFFDRLAKKREHCVITGLAAFRLIVVKSASDIRPGNHGQHKLMHQLRKRRMTN